MKSAAVRATTRRAAAVAAASDAANGASRWRSNARRQQQQQQQQRRQPSRSRSSRSFSSIWLWTATTCLVGTRTSTTTTTTNPFWLSRLPVASAFSIHAIRSGGGGGASRGFGGLPAVATGKRSTTSLGAARSFTTHSSLSELLREFDYDALILDQFGVLHNGKHPLEGTVECVDRIAGGGGSERTDDDDDDGAPKEDNEKKKKKKLRLIVLSNTSSPSETTLDRLETKLGFDRSLFCGAVTSGEEAARHVRETYGTPRSDDDDDPRTGSERRRRFVWCTWDPSNENVPDPLAFLDLCGPNVEPTVDVSAADFVIAHGSGAIRGFGGGDDRRDGAGGEERHEIRSMGGFMDDGNLAEGTPISDLLEECAERNLPLICANPDMVVQYHDGSLKHMPGRIAERYREILEARDGDDDGEPSSSSSSSSLITIYGKPHGEHFEACLRELEEDRARDEEAVRREDDDDDDSAGRRRPLKVAHVGDSLHHDIAGANAAGIPSIFVVGGIHAEELLGPRGDDDDGGVMPSEERLREFFDREGIAPTHVLPVFNY